MLKYIERCILITSACYINNLHCNFDGMTSDSYGSLSKEEWDFATLFSIAFYWADVDSYFAFIESANADQMNFCFHF